jgi:Na+/H+ antiporter NhaD/arsenite permease-like protein
MPVVAVLVFVTACILIATERVTKMVTALVGAGITLGLGVASAERCSTPTRPSSTGTLSS